MMRRTGLLLALVFLLTLPAVTPRIYASDEIQYFAFLRSLWFDRDVSFDNEYRWFYDRGIGASEGFRETFLERTSETGRRITFGTIGSAILWSPFYGVADLIVQSPLGRGRWPRDGYSYPYVAAIAYGSAAYGILAVWIASRVARRLTGDAVAPALLVLLGTPLAFYTYIAPPMAHACSAFAVALMTWVWLRARRTWTPGWAVAFGAAAALMVMVREQDAFFLIGPALDGLRTLMTTTRPRVAVLRAWAVGAFAAGVAYLPQALAYIAVNGAVRPSRLVTRKMTWTSPHALDVLISPAHGFFVWTPLAVLALLGLALMIVTADPPDTPFATRSRPERQGDGRWIAFCLLMMAVGIVYVSGCVESWTVAGAFGQRRFVGMSVLLVVGLSAWWHHLHSRLPRRVFTVICLVCVWWNIGLMVQFGMRLMDRQRMEPARNAYTSFVELPLRLPGIAGRYLVDRESFYDKRSPE